MVLPCFEFGTVHLKFKGVQYLKNIMSNELTDSIEHQFRLHGGYRPVSILLAKSNHSQFMN
jgi:hypothetical protein